MALKLKYTDEHGILHINMSPTSSPNIDTDTSHPELKSPTFDSINHRFGQYDLFGAKYESGGNSGASEARSLFRSRYNSIEEELANTPYAFTNRNNSILDITIKSEDSPSKDIEDDRFFNQLNLKEDNLFGAQCDLKEEPSFSVTQLIHAQDRYFDLSTKQSSLTVLSDTPVRVLENNRVRKLTNKFNSAVKSAPGSAKSRASDISVKDAFRVLSAEKPTREIQVELAANIQAVSTAKKKKESSFAILTETTISSRPSSPRSLPIEPRKERVSPFKGRGFREETSRHNTPKTSTTNSRANSPPRRRTNSLSKIDMAATAVPPLPIHTLSRPHSPINFVKQNIEEVRELSELNREKHEAEAEEKRRIEEEALLKEMGLIDTTVKTDAIRSVIGSRNTSRSNSPSKINLRSRSNSPSAILHFENIAADSRDFINPSDGTSKQVTHKSRVRSVSRSQPQSNNGSPKHSKIPKRQNSVSPPRAAKREVTKKIENNLNKNQRFISSSTSSINDSTRIETVAEKKGMSKSSQHLSISPSNIRGKPPISPGRGGPPPSNKTINPKRLSPIVGTPNRSPNENSKPGSARTPRASPVVRKTNKTAGNTPSISRVTSRQPSRSVSPDKKTTTRPTPSSRSTVNRTTNKPNITRTPSTKSIQKPPISNKPEVKKPISRTNSVKNLTRTPSTKTLNERPPTLKRKESRKDMLERAKSNTKMNEVGSAKVKKDAKGDKIASKTQGSAKKKPETVAETETTTNNAEEIETQDNETQYDSITNEKGDLITLTKKNVVSMTTAAITAQPLEVVTTVTNQLPAAFEKAREKGIFERHSSKDSLAPKDEENNNLEEKKNKKEKVFNEDNVKLKLLQPPYNNPQVERAKQKIDDILKAPEVSTENILNTATIESTEVKNTLKSIANKTRNEIKEKKDDTAKRFKEIKEEIENQAVKGEKEAEKFTEEVRTEATKIVESIITPVEEPKEVIVPEKEIKEIKKDIEPIVMVVNEKNKPNVVENSEIVEKVNESLVKGDPEVEVQSSNVSTPILKVEEKKQNTADGNGSDLSIHSNGGYPGKSTLQRFPQSTSTTPKPPARTKKEAQQTVTKTTAPIEDEKKQNICQRLLGKCAQKTKCCSCCVKPQVDEDEKTNIPKEQKTGMAKWSLCKKTQADDRMKEVEKSAAKLSTIEFENETKRKRSFRDIFCGCCKKSHRVGDSGATRPADQGCFGRRRDPEVVERRDSILSDRPPGKCCNNRLFNWFRGKRRPDIPERRPSMFSKNKSLSPTLPPEDTRPKLDPSLIEHTSVMRGAIPVLPISLAYFCLMCNVLVPGLGTILSGLFCLCFGIPRFGTHDGLKHRIGSFVINLLVGCGQLFTVLFCLVGWGWSIWWGVIMIRVSRKYRKLAAEAAMSEEQAPPVTANNHNSRA